MHDPTGTTHLEVSPATGTLTSTYEKMHGHCHKPVELTEDTEQLNGSQQPPHDVHTVTV